MKLGPTRTSSSGSSSSDLSLKHPRTPRFAEATTVYSPVEPVASPFTSREASVRPQAQPADVGFGYINENGEQEPAIMPATPRSPLKSAMKTPGTPGKKFENPLSPTFREEQILEKHEAMTEKEQARDLV